MGYNIILFEHFKKRFENARKNAETRFKASKKDIAEYLVSLTYRAGNQAYHLSTAYTDYCNSVSNNFIIELSYSLNVVKPDELSNEDSSYFLKYSNQIFEQIVISTNKYFDKWMENPKDVSCDAIQNLRTEIIDIVRTTDTNTKEKIELAISEYNFAVRNAQKNHESKGANANDSHKIKENINTIAAICTIFGFLVTTTFSVYVLFYKKNDSINQQTKPNDSTQTIKTKSDSQMVKPQKNKNEKLDTSKPIQKKYDNVKFNGTLSIKVLNGSVPVPFIAFYAYGYKDNVENFDDKVYEKVIEVDKKLDHISINCKLDFHRWLLEPPLVPLLKENHHLQVNGKIISDDSYEYYDNGKSANFEIDLIYIGN